MHLAELKHHQHERIGELYSAEVRCANWEKRSGREEPLSKDSGYYSMERNKVAEQTAVYRWSACEGVTEFTLDIIFSTGFAEKIQVHLRLIFSSAYLCSF